MRTKQLLTVISAAALMFTSCSMFNNDSKTQEVSEDTTSSLVTLDHIYDGADELLGKTVGQSFILPEKIHKWEPTGLYRLHTSKGYSDDKQHLYDILAKAVRIVTGADPDEQYLTYNEEYRVWRYESPTLNGRSIRGGVSLREVFADEDTPDLGGERPTEEDFIRELFKVSLGQDGVIKTKTGELRASEIAEKASELYLEKSNSLTAPLTSEVSYVRAATIPKYGVEDISVGFTTVYKGVPFFLCGEQLFPHDPRPDGTFDCYEFSPTIWPCLFINYSNGKYSFDGGFGDYTVTESEEITEIIPFTKAVELLKSVFADYSNVQIIYAELNYCAPRRLQPVIEHGDTGIDPEWDAYHLSEAEKGIDWEPYWCFYFDQYKQGEALDCFKVNAVTGDVEPDMRPHENRFELF